MRFFGEGKFPKILGLGLMLVALLAVACGGAAPPTPPPPAAQPTTASRAATQPAETPQAAAQPTAVPAPTSPPVVTKAEVHPGKVTWMVGAWGNERFDHNLGGGAGVQYSKLVHGHLIETNEKSELIPGIASDWSASEDGLTWTVTVRKGVKFHDGTEVTVEDVLWTWRHAWSPEAVEWVVSGDSQSQARLTEKIEQTGTDQVSITSKVADSGFGAQYLAAVSAAVHAPMPKRDKLHDQAEESAYDKNPIATGLLKLVRHVPAEVMEFERFDDYYYQPSNGLPEDRRVKFTSFDMRLIPEESTRVAAMRAGEADIAPVSPAAQKQVEASGGRLVFAPEGVYIWARLLGCFQPEFPCSDKRVRQALDYAIDKELIQDRLYGPELMAAKGWSHITPSTIGYGPELDPWPYDPDKARQLLADAGYPGGEGFGKFIVNTWVSTAIPQQIELAQLAAEFWRKELGIDVEVRVGDETSLRKSRGTGELWGQVMWRENEARVDVSGITRIFYGTPGANVRVHEDQELWDLVNKTLAVFDAEERPKALNNLYRKMREESYELGIGYLNIPWAVGPRILTWEPYPLAVYATDLHTITLK